eukprot:scaffold6148_cov140-Skeletonema_menzelii.AAC.5
MQHCKTGSPLGRPPRAEIYYSIASSYEEVEWCPFRRGIDSAMMCIDSVRTSFARAQNFNV